MNMRIRAGGAALLLAGLMLAACQQSGRPADSASSTASAAPAASTQAPPPLPLEVKGLPDFSGLVTAVGPAVVNVSTVGRMHTADEEVPGMAPNDPFHDFFRRFGPRGPQPPSRGEGSGFIVSADGVILTNAHVVDEASDVTVRLTDRREFTAKVVGVDRRTDVAVLRINAKGLPIVRIGEPDSLRVGEWVLAIGSPFGFDNSVTEGIVSAKARSLPGDAYTPFIQTDVAVNPGNSGGPLFNLRGEVVGINSQIYSRTGGYQGVSFAIPIDVAVNVKDQLVKSGKVSRGRIGVTIQEVNQSLADSFGLPRPQGALVSSVERGAPADKAGLKAGDVILAVDGHAVDRSSELPPLIAAVRPGDEVKLEVWRDRAKRQFTLKVVELEDEKMASAREGGAGNGGKLGLAVRPLTPQERGEIETEGRLVVEEVSGPAAAAGVEAGDVVLAVNGKPVTSAQELRDAVGRSGKTVALLIQRGDAQIYIPVRIG
jgi:serine protease Do